MRFDKTFISIKERGILEIFDVALHVVTDHFKSLFWLLVIGATPWVLLDLWLIGWMLDADGFFQVYYWVMFLLIVSQAQVGTMFMTRYLGQAMFVGRPGIRQTVKEVFETSPYFIWSQGAIRIIVPLFLMCFLIQESNVDSGFFVCFLLLPGMLFIGLLVRAFRPFASEILILERTPVTGAKEKQVNFGRRTKALHGAGGADLFGRFVVSSLIFIALGLALFSLLVISDTAMNLQSNSEYSYLPYYWIVAIWSVAGFSSVIRFLSYIDTRTRQEGWAVELRMRTEGLSLIEELD